MLGDLFGDDGDEMDSTPVSQQYKNNAWYSMAPPSHPRAASGFAGLLNQGATCYMNSLLQAIFMTPELRKALYDLTPSDLRIRWREYEQEMTEKAAPVTSSSSADAEGSAESPADDVSASEPSESTPDSASPSSSEQSSAAEKDISSQVESSEDTTSAAPVESKVDSDHPMMGMLREMGLPDDKIRRAIQLSPTGDVEQLINLIFSGACDEEITPAVVSNSPSAASSASSYVDVDDDGFQSSKRRRIPGGGGDSVLSAEFARTPVTRSGGSGGKRSRGSASTVAPLESKPAAQPPKSSRTAESSPPSSSSNTATSDVTATTAVSTASSSAAATTTKKKKRIARIIPYELRRLFGFLQGVEQDAVSTQRLTRSFGWQGNQALQQQDVHELNRVLFDALETSLRRTPAEKLFKQLYQGAQVNTLTCLECGRISSREEHFMDIPLVVSNQENLLSSLGSLVSLERLCEANQYQCEKCDKKVDALRGTSFRSLPPVLIFCLLRFEYGLYEGVKNGNSFPFPLILDMEPYTEQHCRKAQLAEVEQVKRSDETERQSAEEVSAAVACATDSTVTAPTASESTTPSAASETTSDAAETSASSTVPKAEAAAVETPVATADGDQTSVATADGEETATDASNAKPQLFQPAVNMDSEHLYELSSVVVHVGSHASSGHYFAYIRDPYRLSAAEDNGGDSAQVPTHPDPKGKGEATEDRAKAKEPQQHGRWYEFDDSRVTEIDVEKIATQYGGRSQCAYTVSYRKYTPLSSRPALPALPEDLRELLDEYNAKLREERAEWEREQNRIRVEVCLPSHFWVDEQGTACAIESAAEKENAGKDPENVPTVTKHTVVAEKDESVAALLARLTSEFALECAAFASEAHLSLVSACSGPTHVLRRLEHGETLLSEAGLSDGSVLLLWDGVHVGPDGQQVWNGEGPPQNVQVLEFSTMAAAQPDETAVATAALPPPGPRRTHTVQVRDSTTLSTLANLIAECTALSIDQLYVCQVDDGVRPLWEADDDLENITLFDLKLLPSEPTSYPVRLTVEPLTAALKESGLQQSAASAHWKYRATLMEVYVNDALSGREPQLSLTVACATDQTIGGLKRQVLKEIAENQDQKKDDENEKQYSIHNVLLRRRGLAGTPGEIFSDPTLTLKECAIRDGDRLMVEEGDACAVEGKVLLHCVMAVAERPIGGGEYPVVDLYVDKTATVLECKLAFLETLPAEGREAVECYRVRKTLWSGEAGRFFDSEAQRLRSQNIYGGETLWLEKGEQPIKGDIVLSVQLYVPSVRQVDATLPDALKRSATDAQNQEGSTAGELLKEHSDQAASSPDQAASVQKQDQQPSGANLTKEQNADGSAVPSLWQATHSPMLQYMIQSRHARCRDDVAATLDNLVHVDDIKVSYHLSPRKLCETVLREHPMLSALLATHGVRLWHDQNLLRRLDCSLKKQNCRSDGMLIVELVAVDASSPSASMVAASAAKSAPAVAAPAPAPAQTPVEAGSLAPLAADHFLLYVHRRDPKRKSFTYLCELEVPRDVADLRPYLAALCGCGVEEIATVAKLSPFNLRWRRLFPVTTDGQQRQQRRRRQPKKFTAFRAAARKRQLDALRQQKSHSGEEGPSSPTKTAFFVSLDEDDPTPACSDAAAESQTERSTAAAGESESQVKTSDAVRSAESTTDSSALATDSRSTNSTTTIATAAESTTAAAAADSSSVATAASAESVGSKKRRAAADSTAAEAASSASGGGGGGGEVSGSRKRTAEIAAPTPVKHHAMVMPCNGDVIAFKLASDDPDGADRFSEVDSRGSGGGHGRHGGKRGRADGDFGYGSASSHLGGARGSGYRVQQAGITIDVGFDSDSESESDCEGDVEET